MSWTARISSSRAFQVEFTAHTRPIGLGAMFFETLGVSPGRGAVQRGQAEDLRRDWLRSLGSGYEIREELTSDCLLVEGSPGLAHRLAQLRVPGGGHGIPGEREIRGICFSPGQIAPPIGFMARFRLEGGPGFVRSRRLRPNGRALHGSPGWVPSSSPAWRSRRSAAGRLAPH
jgi:hypothetical protein